MPIVYKPSEILKNVYLIDTMQFSIPRITSAYCYWDGEKCLLMDIGTSDNVPIVIRALKKMHIPLEKVEGIILTHYHFDHAGGSLRLWRKLVKRNPNFKIITTKKMREKLQNAEDHIIGARTTFGEFVGTMKPISPEFADQAFFEVEPDSPLPLNLKNNYVLQLLSTPGHTEGHLSPTIFQNNSPIFCFAGETVGCLYHSTKISPQPTSMPPNFNYDLTMQSLEKLRKLNPINLAFCHFGVITGSEDVNQYFEEFQEYMTSLRSTVIELYSKNPSTKFIVENTASFFSSNGERVDEYYRTVPQSQKFFKNLHLALIYGLLVDLGYRKSKYEK
ncbi:MBL fold metallo-hydrolase [Candidatus Lokiarchaeum ossiferum]|uniref:MBL fold metallo-hydrolase n=1 Tax=Candidatus Lokiarchaeum ossiferum TaxID=2951803 RepID=UPI00352FE579